MLTTTSQVDFEKLAGLAGYKSSKSAATCYENAKKKLMGSAKATIPKQNNNKSDQNGDTPAASTGATPTKKRATPKKNKEQTDDVAEADGADADAESAVATPTPTKKRGRKPKVDENGNPVPPAKRVRKTPKKATTAEVQEAQAEADAEAEAEGDDEATKQEQENGVIGTVNSLFGGGHVAQETGTGKDDDKKVDRKLTAKRHAQLTAEAQDAADEALFDDIDDAVRGED